MWTRTAITNTNPNPDPNALLEPVLVNHQYTAGMQGDAEVHNCWKNAGPYI